MLRLLMKKTDTERGASYTARAPRPRRPFQCPTPTHPPPPPPLFYPTYPARTPRPLPLPPPSAPERRHTLQHQPPLFYPPQLFRLGRPRRGEAVGRRRRQRRGSVIPIAGVNAAGRPTSPPPPPSVPRISRSNSPPPRASPLVPPRENPTAPPLHLPPQPTKHRLDIGARGEQRSDHPCPTARCGGVVWQLLARCRRVDGRHGQPRHHRFPIGDRRGGISGGGGGRGGAEEARVRRTGPVRGSPRGTSSPAANASSRVATWQRQPAICAGASRRLPRKYQVKMKNRGGGRGR
ncbi:hypothetical protein I4F81_011665 [Pyropia yezoensis]|uniref:Uncharacterized protein n=1 Tax=Pyropia yezoensis TaxID=2788 RepID=A0ACC3CGY1_PYRYE|nr:hypothetical protein I4F81_011665 [Neopyropia yezoensis]